MLRSCALLLRKKTHGRRVKPYTHKYSPAKVIPQDTLATSYKGKETYNHKLLDSYAHKMLEYEPFFVAGQFAAEFNELSMHQFVQKTDGKRVLVLRRRGNSRGLRFYPPLRVSELLLPCDRPPQTSRLDNSMDASCQTSGLKNSSGVDGLGRQNKASMWSAETDWVGVPWNEEAALIVRTHQATDTRLGHLVVELKLDTKEDPGTTDASGGKAGGDTGLRRNEGGDGQKERRQLARELMLAANDVCFIPPGWQFRVRFVPNSAYRFVHANHNNPGAAAIVPTPDTFKFARPNLKVEVEHYKRFRRVCDEGKLFPEAQFLATVGDFYSSATVFDKEGHWNRPKDKTTLEVQRGGFDADAF